MCCCLLFTRFLGLQIALNQSDPLYQDKRAIVQKNDKLTIQDYQVCVKGRVIHLELTGTV